MVDMRELTDLGVSTGCAAAGLVGSEALATAVSEYAKITEPWTAVGVSALVKLATGFGLYG